MIILAALVFVACFWVSVIITPYTVGMLTMCPKGSEVVAVWFVTFAGMALWLVKPAYEFEDLVLYGVVL